MQVNTTEYWDNRFQNDWGVKGGPEQTQFFAELLLSLMPGWLIGDIDTRRLDILDLGCAEGDALPVWAARFPGLRLMGADVAPAAIVTARRRYPQFQFELLPTKEPPPSAAAIICSNVIEHFPDWLPMLEAISGSAREHLIVLVPFRETKPLLPEHAVCFDFEIVPPVLGTDLKLVHVSVVKTTLLPNSRWVGHQMLIVWSRTPTGTFGGKIGDLDRMDLRGLAPEQVRICLQLANSGFTSLAEERATLDNLRLASRRERDEAAYRLTELNNEFIRAKVELTNELTRTRVALGNDLTRTKVELGNELARTQVELGNEIEHVKVERDAARHTLSLTLDELARTRVDLGNEVEHAKVERDAARHTLSLTLDELARTRVDLGNEVEHAKVERDAARHTLSLTLDELARTRVDLGNEVEHAKVERDAAQQSLSQMLAALRAAVAAHNDNLEMLARDLQSRFDDLADRHRRVLSMRSVQRLMRALELYGKLRNTPIAMPSMPERTAVEIARLELSLVQVAGLPADHPTNQSCGKIATIAIEE